MTMRSTSSTLTFSSAFALPGYPDELPAGDYEVIVEEERLQGVSFEAFRRTATYLMVKGDAGVTEMRLTSERDLGMARFSNRSLISDQ